MRPKKPAVMSEPGPRCCARTRRGTPCQQPAMGWRERCRMHGGADGIGGQPGNHNALKHGRYSAEAIAQRREVAALLRACQDQLGAMCERDYSF